MVSAGHLVSGRTDPGGRYWKRTRPKRLLLWKDKDAPLVNLPAHAGAVTGVAFNQGGNQLASVGKDGVLRLWSVPPAAPREMVHPDTVVASGLSGG